MNKRQIAAVTGLLAAMLAGCGGSGSDSGKANQTAARLTMGGAAKAPAAARWGSVKFGGGGYVPGLIYHPTSPDVLYARTDMGGAYRWDVASKAWLPITDGFGAIDGYHHGSETMALDPNDDKRVYMGTGMYLSENADARLYISTDRGDSWQYVKLPFSAGSNSPARAVGERLMVDPNQPAILFYATRASGMWKSSDHGQTWSQVASLSTHNMSKSEINAVPQNGVVGFEQVVFDTDTKGTGNATQTIYTAVAPDYAAVAGLAYAMYKTTDGGATWSGIATPADVAGFYVPHMVRNKDGMMYVAFTKTSGPGAGGPSRLYKFDGANWTLLKQYDAQQWVNFGMGGLSVSGTGAGTRIALGVTNSWGNYEGQPVVQLSDDAGLSWREIAAAAPHVPANNGFSGWTDDVEIDPNNPEHILHVHGGGVWETRNASAAKPTWTYASVGIEETATSALMAPPPGASYTLLRSAGDVGTSVQTELLKSPVRGSWGMFNSTFSSDMAWSNPAYMVTTGSHVWNSTVAAAYSTDAGVTWQGFATNHPDALPNENGAGNLAVTKPNNVVWAPSHAAPAYTTDNGASWTYTNLPALAHVGIDRAYHLAADRKNPNKVYAYNSGGAWWAQWSETPHFYTSNDGGHSFTESATFAANSWTADFYATSIAVNPNAEGDVWVTDGKSILHSLDAGATWTRLSATAPIWGQSQFQPDVYGATSIALGKAPAGAQYSASVYVAGVINGVWGVHRSDDGGVSWTRFNDDKHQYGGISTLAADQNVPGRLYLSGGGRGVLFSY